MVHRFRRETFDRRDSVKIFRDHLWVQMRASNTEPILRIMAEAQFAIAEGFCDELAAVVIT